MVLTLPDRGEEAGVERHGEVEAVWRHDRDACMALVEAAPPWWPAPGRAPGAAPLSRSLLASRRPP